MVNHWLHRQKDRKFSLIFSSIWILLVLFRQSVQWSVNVSFWGEEIMSAVPRLVKERLYTCYRLREHPFFWLYSLLFHIRIHNRQSLKYYRLSETSRKIHENIALWLNNKSQGFLLMLVEFKPENVPFFPQHIFCMLLLWMCKVGCDWSLTVDVMEIFYRLAFADGFSWWVKLETKAEKNRFSHRLMNNCLKACRGKYMLKVSLIYPWLI